jgi:hypothetical protein
LSNILFLNCEIFFKISADFVSNKWQEEALRGRRRGRGRCYDEDLEALGRH